MPRKMIQAPKKVDTLLMNKVAEVMRQEGIDNPYQLHHLTGIAKATAYKLYNNPYNLPRENVLTVLCDVFDRQPGDFLVAVKTPKQVLKNT